MKKAILFLILSTNIIGANFDTSFNKTIKHEGNTVFRSKFGEVSKYGITKHTLSSYNKTKKTNYKVEHLELAVAKDIYKERYWNELKLNSLNNQSLANHIFDYGVNSGIYKARKDLQATCNELITEYNLSIQGDTIEVLNVLLEHIEDIKIIEKYKNKRFSFLKRLGTKWDTYGKGWTKRINNL